MKPRTLLPPALAGRPFTVAQAHELGISRHVLRHSRFTHLVGGVYAETAVAARPLIRARAMQLLEPAASLSHHSAAAQLHLPVPEHARGHVTVPRGTLRNVVRVAAVHETRHPENETHDHALITTPTRTFVDLADWLTFLDLVVFGDAAVRRGLVTRQELLDRSAPAAHRRGSRTARAAAALVRDRVDSPRETRLRLVLVQAGLPEPEVNRAVITADRSFVATADLSYFKSRTAIEYDGRQHAEDLWQWGHDLDRRENYDDAGWRVIVVRAHHLLRPWMLVNRVWRILQERGEPNLPQELLRSPYAWAA